jgi:predicted cupin superfamily sugar epimerase
MHHDAQAVIDALALQPLPVEGGWYRSTWHSREQLRDGQPMGTAIIALYSNEPDCYSTFHRLDHDETWHFYSGDPLRLVLLHVDGSSEQVTMGADVVAGQQVQVTVPAGSWQGAHLVDGGRYALFGCTMAPGFTGDVFSGGQLDELLTSWPSRRDDIIRLVRPATPTSMPEGFQQ